jgi:small subunit ribosomal protein S20
MPIKKSAMKAMRQAKKRTERNMKVKESIAYLRRGARKAIEASDVKKAADVAKEVIKAVDKAAQKKVIKKNKAARIKSRLMKKVNAVTKAK